MYRPQIRSILAPTDFSDASVIAFAHALKLAVGLKAEFELFHVEPLNDTSDWHWAPKVIDSLVRWGELPPGSTAEDLQRLGIRARRTMTSGLKADEAIKQEIAEAHADLVVLSTHGRSGVRRWLQPSVATPIATEGAALVLLIPPGSRGFVHPETGAGGIRRVLVPIDHTPHPAPGFDAAALVTGAVPGESVELATLHVGPEDVERDLLRVPPGWALHHWSDAGDPVEQILRNARTWPADLVVMTTEGRRGFLDNLRGSTVERVIDRISCPLLIVPADWTGNV